MIKKRFTLHTLALAVVLSLLGLFTAPTASANTATITGPGSCTTLAGDPVVCDYTFSFNGDIGGAVYPSIYETGNTAEAGVSANAYACGFRSNVGICTLYLSFDPTISGISYITFEAGPSGSVYWSNPESVELVALSPLPAPSSVTLLSLGLLGFLAIKRRRVPAA